MKYVFICVSVTIASFSFIIGHTVGAKQGYIAALVDVMNDIDTKYRLVKTVKQELVWRLNNNYKGCQNE